MGPEERQHFVSLKEYIDQQIEHVLNRMADQHSHSIREVDRAESALSKRLDGMNEFREALKDQSMKMATRDQLDILRANTLGQIDSLRERIVETEKRISGWAASISIVVSLVVSIVTAVVIRWVVK